MRYRSGIQRITTLFVMVMFLVGWQTGYAGGSKKGTKDQEQSEKSEKSDKSKKSI